MELAEPKTAGRTRGRAALRRQLAECGLEARDVKAALAQLGEVRDAATESAGDDRLTIVANAGALGSGETSTLVAIGRQMAEGWSKAAKGHPERPARMAIHGSVVSVGASERGR